MGALSKIQYWKHPKQRMTGKRLVKDLKRLNLRPRNRMIDEQLQVLLYVGIFSAGMMLGIFSQII